MPAFCKVWKAAAGRSPIEMGGVGGKIGKYKTRQHAHVRTWYNLRQEKKDWNQHAYTSKYALNLRIILLPPHVFLYARFCFVFGIPSCVPTSAHTDIIACKRTKQYSGIKLWYTRTNSISNSSSLHTVPAQSSWQSTSNSCFLLKSAYIYTNDHSLHEFKPYIIYRD